MLWTRLMRRVRFYARSCKKLPIHNHSHNRLPVVVTLNLLRTLHRRHRLGTTLHLAISISPTYFLPSPLTPITLHQCPLLSSHLTHNSHPTLKPDDLLIGSDQRESFCVTITYINIIIEFLEILLKKVALPSTCDSCYGLRQSCLGSGCLKS
ncbi:uncharacterized protein EV420DRAFT_1554297 [Desarmillaria tabescens]|uniref:Uncharacterized protein n=1 Tax=Armillaria tabescens TaxID=1929756 RepID=A0AA39K932_ARMTA|nr:uncharacterized protein EV420DRAFT_1554297 [Desarmillaria tabescens]KAK0455561.1 hypothetical protein EV420DRAFT_1554297 [Desarmillaria tabescens]